MGLEGIWWIMRQRRQAHNRGGSGAINLESRDRFVFLGWNLGDRGTRILKLGRRRRGSGKRSPPEASVAGPVPV